MIGQIEKNLMLFLDPAGELDEAKWRFLPWRMQPSGRAEPDLKAKSAVFCFERRDLVGYLLFSWFALRRRLPSGGTKLLHINDGNLSSIFRAEHAAIYRAFAAWHLPRPASLRQRLISLLPLSLRAEKRYVVAEVSGCGKETSRPDKKMPGRCDFMFFSNAAGKLVMASAECMRTGKGFVLKTTNTPTYESILKKEAETMLAVAAAGNGSLLPRVEKPFRIGKRLLVAEEYIRGQNLREILRSLARKGDIKGSCLFMDRLHDWFTGYSFAFRGPLRPLPSCYAHLFDTFSKLYGGHQAGPRIMERGGQILVGMAPEHDGVVTITAHNDLWPGNFIVGDDRLVAVDWERAAENRAPLFDYYWMIISAALEHLVCRSGVAGYSGAFRLFLAGDDGVSRHAEEKLKSYLGTLALDQELHRHFLLLFLMEWSVQGYLVLGRQTAMDRLAYGELLHFVGAGSQSTDGVFRD